MALLLSTKLPLSDVTSHVQASLKSTVSALELISSNQPHTQEVIIQSCPIFFTKTLKNYLM